MRVLITGASGFVAPHLIDALEGQYPTSLEIVATARTTPCVRAATSIILDVTDEQQVQTAIKRFKPDQVFHLAAVAAPAVAQEDPDLAWKVNLHGTLNLARAILRHAPDCCMLNVGSGLVYGGSARANVKLHEETVLAPLDTYGATKAAADLALGAMAEHGLRCVRLRPFNHTGPGQAPTYAIPSFAKQVAEIETASVEPILRVGNLEAQRDFLDVRDVAQAYALASAEADNVNTGTIINVASGTTSSMRHILSELLRMSSCPVKVVTDPDRVRKVDIASVTGDFEVARRLLNWHPIIPLSQTLSDILQEQRAGVKQTR